MNQTVSLRLAASRKELLDLGLRNPLISFTRNRKKITVVDEKSVEVFRILVTEQKAMTFLPLPDRATGEDGGDDLVELLNGDTTDWAKFFAEKDEAGEQSGVAARHTDTRLQTRLAADALHARQLRFHSDARTYMEEQGVNILFLALGFLHWSESDDADTLRRAPLLLVPVHLDRTSAQTQFKLRFTDEEITDNLSLHEKLRAEFNISLPEIGDIEDLDPSAFFDKVRHSIRDKPGWTVMQDDILLGFFSFGKFLMYKDLDENTWPDGRKPSEHSLLEKLLGDQGFREPPCPIHDDAFIDSHLPVNTMNHVMDADSSQTLALLDAVRFGRNLVIQGPPGTGKSQTITNLIAEAAGAGKTVLFISEKMAALEVVKRRLDAIGLGEAALELHSHKTNKKMVIQELEKTLKLKKPVAPDTAADQEACTQARDCANAYSNAANTPMRNSGVNPVEAIGRLQALGPGVSRIQSLDFQIMRDWSPTQWVNARLLVEQTQALLKSTGSPSRNLFRGSAIQALGPDHKVEILAGLASLQKALSALDDAARVLAAALGLPPGDTVDQALQLCRAARTLDRAPALQGIILDASEWAERAADLERLVQAGAGMAAARAQYGAMLIPQAWEQQDWLALRQVYTTLGRKCWRVISPTFRRAAGRVAALCAQPPPATLRDCLALIDAVLQDQTGRAVLAELDALGRAVFGGAWLGESSDWPRIQAVYEWAMETRAAHARLELPAGFLAAAPAIPDTTPLPALADRTHAAAKQWEQVRQTLLRQIGFPEDIGTIGKAPVCVLSTSAKTVFQKNVLNEWCSNIDTLHNLARFNVMKERLAEHNLEAVAEHAFSMPDPGQALLPGFEASWYSGLLRTAWDERPELSRFDRDAHETGIAQFCALDRRLIAHNRAHLALMHWDRMPNPAEGGGELAVISREINKTRRHLPIRKLMIDAGRAVQAIKPVFMMSPMSIASYLPPGALEFDIVVFDEASQVRPADALGALLRGRQAVVVGDTQQLPPTNFFDTMLDSEAEDAEVQSQTMDIESVLSLFLSKNAPQRMLRWHYRSRHESLIAVSNYEFYDNRLVIFPSCGADHTAAGLGFDLLPQTFYDRGRSRTNKEEALNVAQAVMEHARNTPDLTLGVAAFSMSQRDAVALQLEKLRRMDPACEDFFNAHPNEPFFIKNLENVQGDERDVIFISVGYGKTQEGKLSMHFGPVNSAGGERRLNVLITRARLVCRVFCNFTADDIDLSRTQARGVAALKAFLAYARNRTLPVSEATGRAPDSIFEEQVIRALEKHGIPVDPQVGCGGFRIDIGVKDPQATGRYILGIECDGASYHSALAARDRDRLRQEILERLGWRLHRIWSTEWFRDPDKEIKRVELAVRRALEHSGGPAPQDPRPAPVQDIARENTDKTDLAPAAASLAYCEARLDVAHIHDLAAVQPAQLVALVVRVVDVESPVHKGTVMVRITEAAGQRLGGRIKENLQAAVDRACAQGRIERRSAFLWKPGSGAPAVRDRSLLSDRLRDLRLVAPEEIDEALKAALRTGFTLTHEEALKSVAALLGFSKLTKKVRDELEPHIARCLQSGVAASMDDGRICLP